MAAKIPPSHADLFNKPAIAHLATLMPDGQPQVTPVWCDFHEGRVRVNSARGRRKDLNMERDPRVAISMCDPDNAYRYLEVRGRVTASIEEGAVAHIDGLAKKYLGLDVYPHHNDTDVRVIYLIEPDSFSKMG